MTGLTFENNPFSLIKTNAVHMVKVLGTRVLRTTTFWNMKNPIYYLLTSMCFLSCVT